MPYIPLLTLLTLYVYRLNFVPFTDAWQNFGQIGVLLLVIESGITMDIKMIKEFGGWAFLMAATGVFFPVLFSFIVVTLILGSPWQTGLSVGAALAPTSLGFTAQLLKEYKRLNTKEGQFICTAAIIDDVLSLFLLTQILATQGTLSPWSLSEPTISSLGSIAVGVLILYLMDQVFGKVIDKINRAEGLEPEQEEVKKTTSPLLVSADISEQELSMSLSRRRHAHHQDMIVEEEQKAKLRNTGNAVYLCGVFIFATLLGETSAYIGSSALLGAYVAAVPFARIRGTLKAWKAYMEIIVPWLMRIFFAATIGFTIPPLVGSSVGWSFRSLWLGAIFAVLAIIGKCFTGLYTYNRPKNFSNMMILGTAMCGRGEFSYLIISMAAAQNIVSVGDYAATVVGLLLTTLFSPILFITALKTAPKEGKAAELARNLRNEEHGMLGGTNNYSRNSTDNSVSVRGTYLPPSMDRENSMTHSSSGMELNRMVHSGSGVELNKMTDNRNTNLESFGMMNPYLLDKRANPQ
jgi:Kef-type K+ transport system membrane component KefB